MKTLSVLIILFIIPCLAFTQDKIQMLNGRELKVLIVDTSFLEINFQNQIGGKMKDVERYRVFSVNWNNQETVLYRQDSSIGNNYSEHQMRMFVNGGKDAGEKFKSPYVFWGGVVAGFLGAYVQPTLLYNAGKPVDPLSVDNRNALFIRPYFAPVLPICYSLIIGSSWIKIKKSDISNPLYLSEDTYLEGYERVARGSRVQKAIFGSAVGLLTGFVVGAIVPR